jgi:hypothetical protein
LTFNLLGVFSILKGDVMHKVCIRFINNDLLYRRDQFISLIPPIGSVLRFGRQKKLNLKLTQVVYEIPDGRTCNIFLNVQPKGDWDENLFKNCGFCIYNTGSNVSEIRYQRSGSVLD